LTTLVVTAFHITRKARTHSCTPPHSAHIIRCDTPESQSLISEVHSRPQSQHHVRYALRGSSSRSRAELVPPRRCCLNRTSHQAAIIAISAAIRCTPPTGIPLPLAAFPNLSASAADSLLSKFSLRTIPRQIARITTANKRPGTANPAPVVTSRRAYQSLPNLHGESDTFPAVVPG